MTAVAILAWAVLAALAIAGSVVALVVLAIGAGVGLARWIAHRRVAATIGAPADPPRAALIQALLACLPPVVEIYAAVLFLASARPRVIRWRHIDYAVAGPDQVRVLARRAPSGP